MLEEHDVIDMSYERDGRPVLVITDAGITTDPDERLKLKKRGAEEKGAEEKGAEEKGTGPY